MKYIFHEIPGGQRNLHAQYVIKWFESLDEASKDVLMMFMNDDEHTTYDALKIATDEWLDIRCREATRRRKMEV